MADESRTAYVLRNIFFSYVSTFAVAAVSLVSRTVFVYTLGASYLGVSGLFTNVLGILSFSELGIGAAINFSLYEPIARGEREKIKSLLHLYKIAYRAVAAVVTVIGAILFPFLPYLVNTDIAMSEIETYYLIFLFNTVSSYFVTYKTSYVTALQKNYIVTNTNTLGVVATNAMQIAALLLGGDYLEFLLIAAGIGLAQKIATVIYLNHKYPIMTEKNIAPLDSETKAGIVKNVKALIMHQVGGVAVHQTDNIIISVFLSTTTVGLIANYFTLYSFVNRLTDALFTGNVASIGNLVASSTRERQKEIFEVYDFVSFWIYGFIMVAFITLAQPFITLWLGENLLVDDLTVVLLAVSQYLGGLCVITHDFKAAGGRFVEDRWVPIAQSVINLVVSIAAVQVIGLPGVFVGTIVQRLLVNYVRPHIVYKYVLEADEAEYFRRFFVRLALLVVISAGMYAIARVVVAEVTVVNFAILLALTMLVPNAIIALLYRNTRCYQELKEKIGMRIMRRFAR